LVDGQPTSKHFRDLLYDDIVVQASVTSPEMIEKTMTALEQSYNLGAAGGSRRFAGTRWHFNDAYSTLIKRGTAKLRCHPGKEGGTEEGKSVLWPEKLHLEKRRDMGPYTYAAQILLNPKADALQGFKRDWLRFYGSVDHSKMPKYILVDSASTKKKESDYTAMWVVALGLDKNFYVLDMIRDRLALHERAQRLFKWHRDYRPLEVRYERYGMMADIEHIKDKQDSENYHFELTEVSGKAGKDDRIRRLLPVFEQGRMLLPRSLHVTDWEKNTRNLVHDFIEEEYMAFPSSGHKDMLDSLSRIAEPDLQLAWPYETAQFSQKIRYPNLGFV
jgi:predicted phage terminase large subunit-like protein